MNKRLLTLYLRDHLAAGQGGIEFARRIQRENQGNAIGALMERMIPELEQEATALTALLRRLGSRPSRVKMSMAWFGEKLGRLKLNGRVVSYSPVSRLYELEGLSAGVVARQGIWRTLSALRSLHPAIGDMPIKRFADQADRQLDDLIEAHRMVAMVVAGVGEFQAAQETVEEGFEEPRPNL